MAAIGEDAEGTQSDEGEEEEGESEESVDGEEEEEGGGKPAPLPWLGNLVGFFLVAADGAATGQGAGRAAPGVALPVS